jgi:hypothetical protein
MATSDDAGKKIPPYLSYRTFRSFLDGLKAVGVPGRIDRSVMQTLSGANQSWLLGALRYLRLASDEGVPTEALRHMVQAEGVERQKRLQELARDAYPFLFREGFHLQTATPRQLEEAFLGVGPTGDTVRRCVTFFVAFAKDAALPLSPHILRTTRAARAPRRRRGNGSQSQAGLAAGMDERLDEQNPPPSSSGVWAKLLADKFPTLDPSWPDDVKSKWFEAFENLMEMLKKSSQ